MALLEERLAKLEQWIFSTMTCRITTVIVPGERAAGCTNIPECNILEALLTFLPMKKLACMLAALVAFNVAPAQSTRTRLIVRGDDMGYTHSGNEALIKCFTDGIETSIEVIVPSPWFPEAVKMLRQNPGVDIGVHLAITSEWENIKWRPLTDCPSLKDSNGYFYPMVYPNENYPGQSIKEQQWNIKDIEKEFRAQVETGLKLLPRVSHISAHMGCNNISEQVQELTRQLAKEYGVDIDLADYNVNRVGYDGPSKTTAEKIGSFKQMLLTLEPGKRYMFLDHPGLSDNELQAVYHTGYQEVAADRQGVTDLFTDSSVQSAIREKGILLASYHDIAHALPRSTPLAEGFDSKAVPAYLGAVKQAGQELHSLMILRHGKVIAEEWPGNKLPHKNHVMHSVSKTFTSTAVGFAIHEGRLKLTDKVISFFPGDLPGNITPYLRQMTVRDLLIMSCGHDEDPTDKIRNNNDSWEKRFLAFPLKHKPGTHFQYNSLGTYMLSAIVQKVTGQKIADYLQSRLFEPLGISGQYWEESPSGVNTGGWGLFIQTEDMAKMGQFMLQKGKWNNKQLLPAKWFEEASKAQTNQWQESWVAPGQKKENSDWMQGYGYQIWRCRHNAFRADGKDGQFIIVIPDKDAVIVTTANIQDMQDEINLVWQYLLPAMK